MTALAPATQAGAGLCAFPRFQSFRSAATGSGPGGTIISLAAIAVEHIQVALGHFAAQLGSLAKPVFGRVVALFDTASLDTHDTEIVLGGGQTGFGGRAIELGGLGIVFFQPDAVLPHNSEIENGHGIALGGGLAVKVDRLDVIACVPDLPGLAVRPG